MAIVTVGELLDRAEGYETRLEGYYVQIREQSQNNGVRLLTYYLSKHRRRLRSALGDLNPADLQRIRRIELKYGDDATLSGEPRPMETSPSDVTGEELLASAVDHDSLLIAMYKRIRQHQLIAEAQAFFDALIRVEERDIVMLKKMLAVHYF